MLFNNSACLFCIFAGSVNISFVYSIVLSKAFSVIFNDPSCSNNASILYSWYWYILLSMVYKGEPGNTLPNVMTLDLA